jgi:hypothetical protein
MTSCAICYTNSNGMQLRVGIGVGVPPQKNSVSPSSCSFQRGYRHEIRRSPILTSELNAAARSNPDIGLEAVLVGQLAQERFALVRSGRDMEQSVTIGDDRSIESASPVFPIEDR